MASKLIVNEIEHTSGSGSAVTMANAGITAGTIGSAVTGTLGSGVTGGSGLTALGTVVSGVLSGVSLKIHNVSYQVDTTDRSSLYNFGTALTIASGDNPNGAKFLVISSGGAMYCSTSTTVTVRYLEAGATWTDSNGVDTDILSLHRISSHSGAREWQPLSTQLFTYTNSSGGATQVDFKLRTLSGAATRAYGISVYNKFAILAIRMN